MLAVFALILLIIVLFIWIQRKPIANGYIQRALAKRGVTARYHIADLGISTQRLTNVVIGNPNHPDLVADWVEVGTHVSLNGVSVQAIRAGHVRIRGKLVNGKLSLGEIDRLMPPSTGKPFALPTIDADIQDARMHLETPYGTVGLKLTGSGELDDGFSGVLAAVTSKLTVAGCSFDRASAKLRIAVSDTQPLIKGPLGAQQIRCGNVALDHPALQVNALLNGALDRWKGQAGLNVRTMESAAGRAQSLSGAVHFNGGPERTTGTVDLNGQSFATKSASGGVFALDGNYTAGSAGNSFDGTVAAHNAQLAPAMMASFIRVLHGTQGTPVGPLAAKLGSAALRAARDADLNAQLAVDMNSRIVAVSRLNLTAASGAQVAISGNQGARYRWSDGALTLNGLVSTSGGGLPETAIRLAQEAPDGAVTGTAIMRPYQAGSARLALTPVRFSAGGGDSTRISTQVTLSGPLGNGAVDRISMPVDARWNGAGRLDINRGCAPLTFRKLAVSGLVLDPAKLLVCPQSGALLTVQKGRMRGGAQIAAPQLSGHIGSTPLTLAAKGSEFRFADNGFHLADVAARLGSADSMTRLDIGSLDGKIQGGSVGGSFADSAGQIGNVPLLMSKAAGDWKLINGALTLDGGLQIADAQTDSPRFKPLVSDDFHLKLVSSDITAGGTLKTPQRGALVTKVAITHDLATGTGHADLDVPGISFKTDGLQPDDVTPLTYGVIANVDGTVSGQGHIAWNAKGVTSNGDFKTTGTNLAAAFGTVTGLSTTVHFTDLLGMVSSPDEVATVAEVNPGIAVENGVVHYSLPGDQRVKVAGAQWPFAGGQLVLEPTLLDFHAHQERHMTFRVSALDAAQFLQQFDFDNLNATGTFDGILPMVFDDNGGRIVDGHLESQGGGTLAYVGSVSQKDLGTWGNMAFQALKSLKYRNLNITMNGPLSGEMVTRVRFGGVKQGKGTKSNFLLKRLTKLPIVFNVTIRAPFRQLIDSVRSYYDPTTMMQQNLPALIEAEKAKDEKNAAESKTAPDASVQPPESRNMP
ncbi:hypothetical protein GCM10023219_08900 [Stakelama sediminis]